MPKVLTKAARKSKVNTPGRFIVWKIVSLFLLCFLACMALLFLSAWTQEIRARPTRAAMKLTALRAKQIVSPNPAIKSPPIAGPIMHRDMAKAAEEEPVALRHVNVLNQKRAPGEPCTSKAVSGNEQHREKAPCQSKLSMERRQTFLLKRSQDDGLVSIAEILEVM